MEMEEDGRRRQQRYAHLPIPTYEEAISSRPSSTSEIHRGPREVSDDAERQELLGRAGAGGGDEDDASHRQPSVESPRSSEDSDLGLPEVVFGEEDARRDIEELDYLDPGADTGSRRRGGGGGGSSTYHRARLRRNLTKHLANISATFSSLRIPSFRSFYSPVSTADTTPSQHETDHAEPPASTTPTPSPLLHRLWSARFMRNIHISEQYRMSMPVFARLCGLFIIAAVIYTLFALDMFPGSRHRMGVHYDPESVRVFVQDAVSPDRLQEYLRHITSYDHVAGTEGDYYLASWMQEQWVAEAGFDEVAMLDYHVYLNYPTHDGRSAKIVEPEGRRWKAQLEENLVNPTRQQTLAWHGHSKSGEATGHLVYANGGSREDFAWLKEQGIETQGAVALVRYHATQHDRAAKVKAAEHAGCVGVLMYSDPRDDGSGKGDVWPDGPWRPDDSVQRGSVSLTSWVIGDPLTPGWPSKKNAKTISKASSPGLPQIPSLPLPWRDARVFLDALHGQGAQVPPEWTGSSAGGETWFSGSKDGNASVVVELRNKNDENEKQQIWNLHGLIQGLEQPQQKIIVGNHRDAWCFGSVDPGSGTAVMMEVVAIFLKLVRAGWRPLRSIEFVSWDAGEFNLIGSTEYVEEKIDYLREHGVAYMNVDAGVYGTDFRAAASPLLQRALLRVLGRVSDPTSNATLRDIWTRDNVQLPPLGGAGDYVPFQTMAGMSSMDFGFRGPAHRFPSRSCYETFEWMEKFGDPEWGYHSALAQIWTLLILEVADRPLVPFNLNFYAKEITSYVQQLEADALQMYSLSHRDQSVNAATLKEATGFDVSALRGAAGNVTASARMLHSFEEQWSKNVRWAGGLESAEFSLQRLAYNDKVSRFESDLLDLPHGKKNDDDDGNDNETEHIGPSRERHGIPARPQYKHVLFGPALWDGQQAVLFPAVRDALDKGDWKEAQEMLETAARVLERAGRKLAEGVVEG